jgi:hypothetical protein
MSPAEASSDQPEIALEDLKVISNFMDMISYPKAGGRVKHLRRTCDGSVEALPSGTCKCLGVAQRPLLSAS